MKNTRLINALLKQPVDCTPIWIMRQAGRYLPEYRKTRERAGSFIKLCKTPELACEVTLQPLQRYDLDAAILFSDILTIPDAMGLGLHFIEGEGPKFSHLLKTVTEIEKLTVPDMSHLEYVFQAVKLIRRELNEKVPLIGFAGSPWTLACYMLEGGSSKEFQNAKKLLYQYPDTMHQLLTKLSNAITLYLNEQIKAGAQVIMLFDTWGGNLTTDTYQVFSLSYMQMIINALIKEVNQTPIPTIVFTKNGGLWLEKIATIGSDGIGLDWTIDIRDAKQRIGHQVCLQGNLDPAVLLTTPDIIKNETQKIIAAYGSTPGHIFNLGHGITPQVDPDHVAILVNTVHEYSCKLFATP